MILYPIITRQISKVEQKKEIDNYKENIKNENTNYIDFKNIGEILGYIEIPKINVNLPIYEGTTNEILAKGIGHLENTAMPNAGLGTHSVLAGHTGYTKAKLFDDLDKLKIGDEFYINFWDNKIKYIIDDVKIVEPNDTSYIKEDETKEYVTLVTCTPQILNTKRLLVRGIKI